MICVKLSQAVVHHRVYQVHCGREGCSAPACQNVIVFGVLGVCGLVLVLTLLSVWDFKGCVAIGISDENGAESCENCDQNACEAECTSKGGKKLDVPCLVVEGFGPTVFWLLFIFDYVTAVVTLLTFLNMSCLLSEIFIIQKVSVHRTWRGLSLLCFVHV